MIFTVSGDMRRIGKSTTLLVKCRAADFSGGQFDARYQMPEKHTQLFTRFHLLEVTWKKNNNKICHKLYMRNMHHKLCASQSHLKHWYVNSNERASMQHAAVKNHVLKEYLMHCQMIKKLFKI